MTPQLVSCMFQKLTKNVSKQKINSVYFNENNFWRTSSVNKVRFGTWTDHFAMQYNVDFMQHAQKPKCQSSSIFITPGR